MQKSTFLFPNKQAGSVLVIALFLICIIAVFGIGLARISWANYRFSRLRSNKFLAREAMKAVVLSLKLDRMNDATPTYDTSSELPKETEYKFGGLILTYSVIDEESKININTVTSSELKELPGMDKKKASAIIDSDYRPFYLKNALLALDEIDEESYAEIKDSVTIYGNGMVNINTCSESVLTALGLKDDLINRIMDFRLGADGKTGTSDDGFCDSQSSIITDLTEGTYLSLSEEQAIVSLVSKNLLGVKSDNYAIEADVYVDQRPVSKYFVVIGKEGIKNKYNVRESMQY